MTCSLTLTLSLNTSWAKKLLPVSLVVLVPLSGWLADAQYGNFKVFQSGVVLLFISAVLSCICAILSAGGERNSIAIFILIVVASLAFYLGASASAITAFQLGIDQMLDASSNNIISFIKWFCFSILLGTWSSKVIIKGTQFCATDSYLISLAYVQ